MSFARDFSGDTYRQYTEFSRPSSRSRSNSASMIAVNDASVFPLPVGAHTSAFSPSETSGIASFCGGVKNPPFSGTNSPNRSTHHRLTDGDSDDRTSASSTSLGSTSTSPTESSRAKASIQARVRPRD